MLVNELFWPFFSFIFPGCKATRKEQGEELTASVEGHAAGTGKVMLLKTTLVDELLSSNVASGKENSCGDALGEQRARGEAGVVPVGV